MESSASGDNENFTLVWLPTKRVFAFGLQVSYFAGFK
jgi:hypothetical protein